MHLNTPITALKGVGKTRAQAILRLGIETVEDLVYYFPRAYECRGDIRALANAPLNENCALLLTVGTSVKSAKIRNGLTISKFKAFDETGSVEIVFFNSPYVKDVFHVGSEFRFWGKLSLSKKQLQLQNPKYEAYSEAKPLADILPVYPLTAGLSSKILGNLIGSVLDLVATSVIDPLPESIRLECKLPSLGFALKNIHFPENPESLSKSLSRLAFDEMLLFGLGISTATHCKSKNEGVAFSPCSMQPFCQLLPYELTNDQKQAVNDIYRDTVISEGKKFISPMARIIVGDVGSGKTVCALMAIYLCVKSGYQAALMVPTEILANQHYIEAKELFSKLDIKVELLTGSTRASQKRRIYEDISSGEAQVVIGTHALISDKLCFSSLGLIITDEQHRFGVGQRTVLKEKAKHAHMLVMSATPIPRTLALTMYGDLDISRIKQMPKGRSPVDTFVVDSSYKTRLRDFISKQVALGGQCYVVCPSIEPLENENIVEPTSLSSPLADSNRINLKNAIEYTEELKNHLPQLRIACLHGKMKAAEKDEIMNSFSSGEIDVLVSTTVIEVGINVPNASLMIIENAERFGLSQLHQLRGRVGRGKRKSYCVLVSDMKSEKSRARLDTMKETNDGYEIAERDLQLRGPGDFFSSLSGDNIRQSGGFEFKFSKLCDDITLMEKAFSTAKSITQQDPTLNRPEHIGLKKLLAKTLSQGASTIS